MAQHGRRAKSILRECYMMESSNRKSTLEKQIKEKINEKCPTSLDELINDSLFNKNILYSDDDIFLMGDPRLFHLLEDTEMIFVDGTRKCCPRNEFKKLYCIHCLKASSSFPVIYALLKGQNNATYTKLFTIVSEITKIDLSTTKAYLMGDAEINGFHYFKKTVKKKNCWFHLCQSIYRHCQKIGKLEYDNKNNLYFLARSLMYFPLIKIKRIPSMLKYLEKKYTGTKEKLLLHYFKANYILGKYKIDFWNVRDIPVRTNNFLESFNGMINRLIKYDHPPLYELLEILNNIIEDEYIKYLEVVKKNHPIRKDKKYLNKQSIFYQIIQSEDAYDDESLLNAFIENDPVQFNVFEDEEENEICLDMEMDDSMYSSITNELSPEKEPTRKCLKYINNNDEKTHTIIEKNQSKERIKENKERRKLVEKL
ncbi:hypothetical protein IJD44_02770, partial [bacterium]|nr:hypothetical protein [bacterium]